MIKLEHSTHLFREDKLVIDVNKMCQHISSLLNSCNATLQRCNNNAHQKGQLSDTLGIPQLRQLEPFLEAMAMADILWIEKWEV